MKTEYMIFKVSPRAVVSSGPCMSRIQFLLVLGLRPHVLNGWLLLEPILSSHRFPTVLCDVGLPNTATWHRWWHYGGVLRDE